MTQRGDRKRTFALADDKVRLHNASWHIKKNCKKKNLVSIFTYRQNLNPSAVYDRFIHTTKSGCCLVNFIYSLVYYNTYSFSFSLSPSLFLTLSLSFSLSFSLPISLFSLFPSFSLFSLSASLFLHFPLDSDKDFKNQLLILFQ